MTREVDSDVIVQEADDIASKIIGILVGKFKEKEGRDPDADEVGQLLEELSEERVAEMLGMDEGGMKKEVEEESVVNGVKGENVEEEASKVDLHSGDAPVPKGAPAKSSTPKGEEHPLTEVRAVRSPPKRKQPLIEGVGVVESKKQKADE